MRIVPERYNKVPHFNGLSSVFCPKIKCLSLLYLNFSWPTVVYEESWVFMSQRVYESMGHESMSQWVSAVTQTHKMKAKISECLSLITETRAEAYR